MEGTSRARFILGNHDVSFRRNKEEMRKKKSKMENDKEAQERELRKRGAEARVAIKCLFFYVNEDFCSYALIMLLQNSHPW